jgi:hypothetical protein
MSEDKLTAFLRNSKDWSRLKTSIPGIYILKMPAYKSSPIRLAVELNPVNDSGTPKKRRGLILRSSTELEDFKEIFQYEKLSKLLSLIDSVNPQQKTIQMKKEEDIIQI